MGRLTGSKQHAVRIAWGAQSSVVVYCLAVYCIKHSYSSYLSRHCSDSLKVTLSTILSKALGTQQAWVQIDCRMLRPSQNKEHLQSLHLFKITLWYSQKNSHFKWINIALPFIVLKLSQCLKRFWPHPAIKLPLILFIFTCKYQVSTFKKINKLTLSLRFPVCIKIMQFYYEQTAYSTCDVTELRGHILRSIEFLNVWLLKVTNWQWERAENLPVVQCLDVYLLCRNKHLNRHQKKMT